MDRTVESDVCVTIAAAYGAAYLGAAVWDEENSKSWYTRAALAAVGAVAGALTGGFVGYNLVNNPISTTLGGILAFTFLSKSSTTTQVCYTVDSDGKIKYGSPTRLSESYATPEESKAYRQKLIEALQKDL